MLQQKIGQRALTDFGRRIEVIFLKKDSQMDNLEVKKNSNRIKTVFELFTGHI